MDFPRKENGCIGSRGWHARLSGWAGCKYVHALFDVLDGALVLVVEVLNLLLDRALLAQLEALLDLLDVDSVALLEELVLLLPALDLLLELAVLNAYETGGQIREGFRPPADWQ